VGEFLSVSEALELLLTEFKPVDFETLQLKDSFGRVLAKTIISEIDLPVFTNSSMDGFAVRAEDLKNASTSQPMKLRVVADIPAGEITTIRLESGQAARIMTGAPLPAGADAVTPIENTDHHQIRHKPDSDLPQDVMVFQKVSGGDYIRLQGQDVQRGEEVLLAGTKIKPQDIGFLAMLGVDQLQVYRRPKIALISTGDELVPLGQSLQPGKIHDSNAYTLSALVRRVGGEPIYLGILSDKEEAVRMGLDHAVNAGADLILSTAGVSVGAFDFVRQVVETHGQLSFWRVNMRPGKPLAFGSYRGTPFIGLPGNPVSAFVGFEVFVRPALLKLSGLSITDRPTVKVKLEEFISSDGRQSYLRAIVRPDKSGWIARLTGHQGSGNMRSLVQANALLIIPSGVKSLPVGAETEAWLLDGAVEDQYY
jgi:molybdopterin molybdotransferase